MKKIIVLSMLSFLLASCSTSAKRENIDLSGKYSITQIQNIEEINGDGTNYYMEFDKNSFISKVDCNTLKGEYKIAQDTVAMLVTISSRMMCPANNEEIFKQNISAVDDVKLKDNEVYLISKNQTVITLKKL